MANSDADRNLVYGILAVQVQFIDMPQLIRLVNRWQRDNKESLGEMLVKEGILTPTRRALLDDLVREHLLDHDDDPAQSLAGVSSSQSIASDLRLDDDSLWRGFDGSFHILRERAEAAGVSRDVGKPTSRSERFKVKQIHARGGLGQVSIAHDDELHREVALKEILEEYADDALSRKRFVLEAEITGRLEHPGVVPVYGLGRDENDRPFYAMRFIRGHSLKKAIAAFHREEGPNRDPGERSRGLRRLLRQFIDVCNAVNYAHTRGVIHRDLKPSNVMLGPYGETLVVDWGLAKPVGRVEVLPDQEEKTLYPVLADDIVATQAGRAVGTPEFMSPEQAEGKSDELGPSSDIYALGAMLYCLLTGVAPFNSRDDLDVRKAQEDLADQLNRPLSTAEMRQAAIEVVLEKVQTGNFIEPRAIDPRIPGTLEAICMRAMSVEPESRYETAQEIADSIEHWLSEEPLSAWRTAVNRYEALMDEYPEDNDNLERLALERTNLGLVLSGTARLPEAEPLFRLAIHDYESLRKANPRAVHLAAQQMHTRVLLHRVLTTQGRVNDAEEVQQAIDGEMENLSRLSLVGTNLPTGLLTLGYSPANGLGQLVPSAMDTAAFGSPATGSGESVPEEIAERPISFNTGDQFQAGVEGRYRLVQQIATGGTSTVWLAFDQDLNRRVALKHLTKSPPDDASETSFLREAQITSQLEHPGIPQIYTLGYTNNGSMPFFTMKWIDGKTMLEAIQDFNAVVTSEAEQVTSRSKNLLPPFLAACRALGHAHTKGVIHRDPKPANILLGESANAFVVDWGLAVIVGADDPADEPTITLAENVSAASFGGGQILGTPVYMSPEQANAEYERLDPRTDIYGLGATLFHVLTGKPPFTDDSVEEIIPRIAAGDIPRPISVLESVPAELDRICAKAMSHDPSDRYATVDQLAQEIETWLDTADQ